MIALIGCIVCSSFIFVLFKVFPKYNIDTFQAIVFNYFAATACALLFFGKELNQIPSNINVILIAAIACALLFISLFSLMGFSSQKNGLAITSVAVKMSMAVSLIAMIIAYKEPLSILKISGIACAFLGVLLVSIQKKEKSDSKSSVWMLVVLFFGSGLLDFLLNYTQKYELNDWHAGLFSGLGFFLAGLIGLCIIIVQIIKKKMKFAFKNVIAGFVLGIPNYFSIYLLMNAYQTSDWNDSTVLAILNVSIVLIASFIGLLLFQEKLSLKKGFGLMFSILAIMLLFLAT